jgi:hypothetical protein
MVTIVLSFQAGHSDYPVALSHSSTSFIGGFMFDNHDRAMRVIFLLALIVLALDLLVWRPL